MEKTEEIPWVMLAMLHNMIVLEKAVYLFMTLPMEGPDDLEGENDYPDSVELEPLPEMHQLESKYYDLQPDEMERARRLAHNALQLSTHRRAFSYVCVSAGIDPELILKNLPGGPGYSYQPGLSNQFLREQIERAVNAITIGRVDTNLLEELIEFYEMQLSIFQEKFEVVLEDEEPEPPNP